jgi:tetratricopeptide (TPR) repeat protein
VISTKSDVKKTNPNKPSFTRESPFFKPFGRKRSKLLPDAPFARKIQTMKHRSFQGQRMKSKKATKTKIRRYRQAVQRNPNDADACYNLGVYYARSGNYKKAIEAFKRAVTVRPDDAEAHFSLGLAYGQKGLCEEEIQAYKHAVRIKPDLARAYCNLGNSYNKLGLYKQSIEAFKQAVKINPHDAAAHHNLGATYLQTGDRNAALEECKILEMLDSDLADKLFSFIGILDKQASTKYDELFDLLCRHSERYYTEAERIFRKFDNKWNHYPAKFEIDVYLYSLLSFAIVEFKHNIYVAKEIQTHFVTRLIQHFTGNISSADTFENVIGSRVDSYCRLKRDCITNNKNVEISMLDEVLHNLRFSNSVGQIVANRGYVPADDFDWIQLRTDMIPIQMSESIEFCSCLWELFIATPDIRLLSSEEMDNRIGRGAKRAKQILSGSDLTKTGDSRVIRRILKEHKKWWRFWK